MGGIRCSYKNCKNSSDSSKKSTFFRYPVNDPERCNKWIQNACKEQFFQHTTQQLRNRVVCDMHFESTCFTNPLRKRLLPNAIPTLDVHFDNVEVLPVNPDCTVFMIKTDSLQAVPKSSNVQSYIYKDDTLVPHGNGKISDIHPEDEGDCEIVDVFISSSDANLKTDTITNSVQDGSDVLLEDGNQQVKEDHNIIYNDFASSINAKLESSEESHNTDTTNDNMVANNIQTNGNKLKKQFRKRLLLHMNKQTREVTSIKKILKSSAVRKPVNRSGAVKYLSRHLPPSLSSVLKYNIFYKNDDFGEADFEFFRDIYSTSPQVFNMLREKYHWRMPDPKQIQRAKEESIWFTQTIENILFCK